MSNIEEYSEKHIHFIDLTIPRMLEDILTNINNNQFSVVDLGCGDGKFLYALYQKGLLKNARNIVGVDISEERIERLKKLCPFAEGIVADVCNLTQIFNNSFDLAISSQVIEHIPDDSKMLKDVYQILNPNGYFYVSTVVKKCMAFYIYRNNGKFRLDPTHVREYSSKEEFLSLLKRNGFEIISWRTTNVSYPIMDLIVRVLIKVGKLKPDPLFYQKHKMLEKLRVIKFKVVGYHTIEVVGKVWE